MYKNEKQALKWIIRQFFWYNISLVSSSIVLFCFLFFSLLCLFKIVYKNKLLLFSFFSLFLYFFIFIFLLSFFLSFVYFFSFLFFVYLFLYFFFSFLFLYFFSFLFIIKSGDGGHRSHCPFHAKEMLYHLSYIPILFFSFSNPTSFEL